MIRTALCSNQIGVGLEMEYEGVSARTSMGIGDTMAANGEELLLLNFKTDGSLRPNDRNTEITFYQPLSGKNILRALDQIKRINAEVGYEVSWRCGMHVHIDHRGASYATAYRGLILFTLIEPLLFQWAGPARRESKFCPATSDILLSIWDDKSNPARTMALQKKMPRLAKYSAANLGALHRLGSVEYRYGNSTTDTDIMLDYINIGMGLRLIAEEFESGYEIIEAVLTATTPNEWLREYAPKPMAKALERTAADMDALASEVSIFAALKLAERETDVPETIITGHGE